MCVPRIPRNYLFKVGKLQLNAHVNNDVCIQICKHIRSESYSLCFLILLDASWRWISISKHRYYFGLKPKLNNKVQLKKQDPLKKKNNNNNNNIP